MVIFKISSSDHKNCVLLSSSYFPPFSAKSRFPPIWKLHGEVMGVPMSGEGAESELLPGFPAAASLQNGAI